MQKLLINAIIVNEGISFKGHLLINEEIIDKVFVGEIPDIEDVEKINLEGFHLLPGVIDDQVHFREPGMTYKGEIFTESRAAVAGGVTSYMDMPNNNPPILTQELLESKYEIASRNSMANFSFYMGTSNDNIEEVLKTDPMNVCGIKIFMGSSTGNMLVSDEKTLSEIFSKSKLLIATHCEDETTIRQNIAAAKIKYGEEVPVAEHPNIRSAEACFLSSSFAVSLAKKYGTRLHVLHLSTKGEMELFEDKPLVEKQITAEVCVHHLIFNSDDYEEKGNLIKWNPAIKHESDRLALKEALKSGKVDVVATDHAPHLETEKQNTYFKSPSGGPLVQHSLQAMLEFFHDGDFTLEFIVEKMCHAPANCFKVRKRGFIRPGYFADIVVVDLNKSQKVEKSNIHYKCNWSPFEGKIFRSSIVKTFVNGKLAFNDGQFNEDVRGMRLLFDRVDNQ